MPKKDERINAAKKLRKALQIALSAVELEPGDVADLAGVWDDFDPSAKYKKGEICTYGGKTYVCLKTTKRGGTPDKDSTHWELFGGAVTPDVLWEGNSSQTGTFDPSPYSRLEITGRETTTNTVTESSSAPFSAGKASEGTGRFVFYYDPFSGGTAAYISGIEINVLKVTGYK